MIITVTGVLHRKGGFVDKKSGQVVVFNNIEIHGLCPMPSPTNEGFSVGRASFSEKIQFDETRLHSIFGTVPTDDDLKSMEGRDFEFYYNHNRQLDMIKPFEPPAAKKGV